MALSRRDFLSTAGSAGALGVMAGGAAGASGVWRAGADRPFAFDAMGEMRLEYDGPLIDQIRASGLSACTVTLGDPRLYEEEAYRDALAAGGGL